MLDIDSWTKRYYLTNISGPEEKLKYRASVPLEYGDWLYLQHYGSKDWAAHGIEFANTENAIALYVAGELQTQIPKSRNRLFLKTISSFEYWQGSVVKLDSEYKSIVNGNSHIELLGYTHNNIFYTPQAYREQLVPILHEVAFNGFCHDNQVMLFLNPVNIISAGEEITTYDVELLSPQSKPVWHNRIVAYKYTPDKQIEHDIPNTGYTLQFQNTDGYSWNYRLERGGKINPIPRS